MIRRYANTSGEYRDRQDIVKAIYNDEAADMPSRFQLVSMNAWN